MHARRIMVELTPDQQARLEQARREVEAELPELIALGKELRRAGEEPTISGRLRQAIHASSVEFSTLADEAGIPLETLHEFLRGRRPLSSDVMDRLAARLGYDLMPSA